MDDSHLNPVRSARFDSPAISLLRDGGIGAYAALLAGEAALHPEKPG
jgi:hypothetical protein